jgi:hypothetical protein
MVVRVRQREALLGESASGRIPDLSAVIAVPAENKCARSPRLRFPARTLLFPSSLVSLPVPGFLSREHPLRFDALPAMQRECGCVAVMPRHESAA